VDSGISRVHKIPVTAVHHLARLKEIAVKDKEKWEGEL